MGTWEVVGGRILLLSQLALCPAVPSPTGGECRPDSIPVMVSSMDYCLVPLSCFKYSPHLNESSRVLWVPGIGGSIGVLQYNIPQKPRRP